MARANKGIPVQPAGCQGWIANSRVYFPIIAIDNDEILRVLPVDAIVSAVLKDASVR